MEKKIRLLAWGDYCCSTGFGKVMSEIMVNLYATGRYEIDVIGINYDGGPYDQVRFPGRIWPALQAVRMQGNYGDVFGRQHVLDRLSSEPYDVVFLLQDTFIVQGFIPQLLDAREKNPRKPKIVYYFPIDAAPIKKDWAEQVIAATDYPVVYTQFGKKEVLKWLPELKLDVIYHGTNTEDFYAIDNYAAKKAFKGDYFQNRADDKFLITNVNRNQARKDVARCFAIVRELKDRGHKDIMLYMHMMHNDVGGNLLVMADNFGLKHGVDFLFPNPEVFNPDKGLDISIVNMIYNVSDCVLTTTLGEGWGLSITEAMATKTPVLAPNNTSISEILANNRGLLIPCGGKNLWITKENDNERIRPLVDVEKAADAIEKLKAAKRIPDLEGAYKWVQAQTWKKIASRWVEVIDKAASEASEEVPSMSRQQRRAEERKQKKEVERASLSI